MPINPTCFYCAEVDKKINQVHPLTDLHPVKVRLVFESEAGARSDEVEGYKGPFDAYYCRDHFNNGHPVQPPFHCLIAPGSTCVECEVRPATIVSRS